MNGSERPHEAGRRSTPLEELRSLSEKELEDVTEAIVERRQLTTRFLEEIEVEIQAAVRLLQRLGEPWQRGDRTDYEFMRISLDKALASRKKERRDRLVQTWKDLVDLKRRHVELSRQVSALG